MVTIDPYDEGVEERASSLVRHRTIASIAVSVLALTMCGGADDEPSLTDLLDRAGTYVQQFEREFALVLSDEEYRQAESFDSERKIEETNDIPRPYKIERQLDVHSEMLFMWVPQDRSWISVRSALKVGHQSIADSKDRLERVLKDDAPGRLTRLRQLAAESARFNLGFYHDYNSPTLALQFLDREFQPRFTFTLAGRDRMNGISAWKLAFAERQQPTVIMSDGENLFSTGSLWLRASDGIVLRTLLTLKVPATRNKVGMNGSVAVEYRRDAKLAMWVPSRMEEGYTQIGGTNDTIHCTATYSHFRRFETSSRILP
jgi:hypothetical protein